MSKMTANEFALSQLTDEQLQDIRALMDGAANHGDKEQIAICASALDGDQGAIDECLRIIADDDQGDREE